MRHTPLLSGIIILLFCLITIPSEALVPSESAARPTMSAWEEKISSDLLPLIDERFLLPGETQEGTAKGTVRQTGIKGTSTDEVFVYIRVAETAPVGNLDRWCIEVIDRDEGTHRVAAWVRVSDLPGLAAEVWVRSIQTVIPPIANTGSVNTQGDQILKADQLRRTTGLSGQGVKVGVISTGVDHWRDAEASGDLPSTLHILSNSAGGDEGTAMLEIIHDIAPEADLYFHDTGTNTIAFDRAVDALAEAGCSVIVDDISWLGEPFFEDGPVAVHIQEKIRNGRLVYVTSAGNYAQKHYQGTYFDDGSGWHDFSAGRSESRKKIYLTIPPGGSIRAVLQWDDQFGTSVNDYDLYLTEQYPYSGVTLKKSTNSQTGSADPFEWVSYTNDKSYTINAELDVNNYMNLAESRTLELQMYISSGTSISLDNLVSADSISGQAAVPDVLTIGALGATSPNQLEPFSSRGPVTIVYPHREIRQKPNLCGIDGVTVTGSGGFPNRFYGTSAAAPHIAGIAALLWSISPSLTPGQIRTALADGAVDLGDPGRDTLYGAGRVDALASKEMISTDGKITVSGPIVIDMPGTYLLDRDIIDCQNTVGIEIRASNVVFDGQGHLISGLNRGGSAGIFVSKDPDNPLTGVTIKNVNVNRWDYGIYYLNANTGVIQEVRTTGNEKYGIVLYAESSGNTIVDNMLSDNGDGIYLTTSSNGNTIRNTSIRGNRNHGISIFDSTSNVLESNSITGASICGVMFFTANSNTLTSSTITGDTYGIQIYHSDSNILKNNTITGSTGAGVYLDQSQENSIYNNYFKNLYNALVEGTGTQNTWNHERITGTNIVGGPSIGGNYWATPSGNGFSETHADNNHDGFCEEGYAIPIELDEKNTDKAPLVISPSSSVTKPTAGFWATPISGTAPLSVQFTDTSTSTPARWTWDFGDGQNSSGLETEAPNRTEQNPVHHYTHPGTYSVNLTVSNPQGDDTMIKAGYITVFGPVIPIQSMVLTPTDQNGDGKYEDLNGNGNPDFGDVVIFFNQLDWIEKNEPVDAFDFNNNGAIDFNDIVVLFNQL